MGTANGILALLEEDEPELKLYGLKQLDALVDKIWAEIADGVDKIEELYEDVDFSDRERAALVASKVYFHLGEFGDSLQLALGAGDLFDVNSDSEYVETLIAKAMEEYFRLRRLQDRRKTTTTFPASPRLGGVKPRSEPRAGDEKIDPRLESIVERMFDRCFKEEEYRQVVGAAMEGLRLDIIERAIDRESEAETTLMLGFVYRLCMKTNAGTREFRSRVLRLLCDKWQRQSTPDYGSIIQCLIFLDDAKQAGVILRELIESDVEGKELVAYQLAFDLVENAPQRFISIIRTSLPNRPPTPVPVIEAREGGEEWEDVDDEDEDVDEEIVVEGGEKEEEEINGDKDNEEPPKPQQPEDPPIHIRLRQMHDILSGEVSIALHLSFLARYCKSDMQIMKNTKLRVDPRSDIVNQGLLFANALMHSGTTQDRFLRENLEWLARFTNWAKFSATASLGVIHRGQLERGRAVLAPYLPGGPGEPSGSPYSEGGSLYALGLVHANHGGEVVDYLVSQLSSPGVSEAVQHGACLGIGVSAMGTGAEALYDTLKNVLYTDDAIAGEAAGLALGLVYAGTGNGTAISEMLAYAHDTQHEKIIRALALGVALILVGREEGADVVIEQLCSERDALLRYGGMYAVGLAYAGTSNNDALRRLLHYAVADVSDDVRRAAVTNIGLLMFRHPNQVPSMVALLTESYNPHVRHGAAVALGLACAGTGQRHAIELLEPLAEDPVDYVRQGALISLAMVLMQISEVEEPKVAEVRKLFETVSHKSHENVLARFGAVLAEGLIDAGGRNVNIGLVSRHGHANVPAIIGATLFTQYWNWFPLIHMMSLAFTPTAMIGVNSELKMPVFQFKSSARPSTYEYPPPVSQRAGAGKKEKIAAVLSVTKRSEARKSKKEKEREEKEKKEKEEKEKKEKEEEEKAKKENEPLFEVLSNPHRVTPRQSDVIEFNVTPRYQPVLPLGRHSGVIVMRDTEPEADVEYVVKDEGEGEGKGKEEEKEKKEEKKDKDEVVHVDVEVPDAFELDESELD